MTKHLSNFSFGINNFNIIANPNSNIKNNNGNNSNINSDDNNIVINNKTDQIIIITIKNILSQLIVYRGDKELVEYIINKNKLKSNDKKSIFDYDSNEAVKNWLLQYIKKLKNHRNKKNENNDNNEISEKKIYRKNDYDEDDN